MKRIVAGLYFAWTVLMLIVAVVFRLAGMVVGTAVAAFIAGYQAGKA